MPPFGRSLLPLWWLDPQHTYLNHGTVGATPRAVLAAQQQLQQEIEAHPARFMLRELMHLQPGEPAVRPRLRRAADAVAAFLGAHGDDLVFVDNASAGINAVLRSLDLKPGDELLIHDLAYGAVARTAAFVARQHGATVATFAWPFPVADAAAADPATWVDALASRITSRTRIAIVDHIVSETALVLPLAAIAAACAARGVPVLVDGAHAPGAIELALPGLGVDWYVGNLHKWAFAPRGTGILWVAPQRRAGLHPGVISWGLDQGLAQEFDWTGTRDPSGWLSAPAGLAFMHETLGVAAMRRHNHALAWSAAHALAERWGQPFATPEAMVGSMVTLALPQRLNERPGGTPAGAARLKDWLLYERRIEAQVLAIRGALWVRISAQVYNDMADIERLALAIEEFDA